MPEITLISLKLCGAFAATETFATACVGLNTHKRRTSTSCEPKPIVTWPSTKFIFAAVMSTIAVAPAGSAFGLIERICGAPAPGYVNVGGAALDRIVEFWPSLLYTVTAAVCPLVPGGGATVNVPCAS